METQEKREITQFRRAPQVQQLSSVRHSWAVWKFWPQFRPKTGRSKEIAVNKCAKYQDAVVMMMVVMVMMTTNGAIIMFIIMTMYVCTFIVEGLCVYIYIYVHDMLSLYIYIHMMYSCIVWILMRWVGYGVVW